MASKCVSGVRLREFRVRVWRGRVLAADAKKAGSASEVALRLPRPPILMGSDACVHCRSFKETSESFPIRGVVSRRRFPTRDVCHRDGIGRSESFLTRPVNSSELKGHPAWL